MSGVQTFYRIAVMTSDESEDTVSAAMTRREALRLAIEVLELLEADDDPEFVVVVTGTLTVTDGLANYRIAVKPWDESEDTVSAVMTRKEAIRLAIGVLGLLEADDEPEVVVVVTGALTVTDRLGP